MAFVEHTGRKFTALSREFNYSPGSLLSFDMHPEIYNIPHIGADAGSGVTITFLDSFNGILGSISLYNTSNPSGFVTPLIQVPGQQLNYTNLIDEYANLAGLASGDPISKFTLQYGAYGELVNTGTSLQTSGAKVWFDLYIRHL